MCHHLQDRKQQVVFDLDSFALVLLNLQVQWLLDNYEVAEGMILPRSTPYNHYVRHCNENKLHPVGPGHFGQFINSAFPELKSRRLGPKRPMLVFFSFPQN